MQRFAARVILLSLMMAPPLLSARGDDSQPQLGKYGKLLLDEKFDAAELPANWKSNSGALRVEGGVLQASEKASDRHVGAFRYPLPLKDCAVQIDFRFAAGSKVLNLGFDPAPGELKKKGHLFSVAVTPQSWSVIEHPDKNNPQSRNKSLASAKTTFEPGRWYALLLECRGVVAQIAGQGSLQGTSPDFHVRKPGLVFRMGGPDYQAISLDNIKVWELK